MHDGILNDAIMHYGEHHQLLKCVEELRELADAIEEMENGDGTVDHVAEEAADVRITLEQMRRIMARRVPRFCSMVAEWEEYKSIRLRKRMMEEV